MNKYVRIDTSFFRSRVGRRIFLLFVSCAFLPIGVLATITYTQVNGQLNEQSQLRLQQATKSIGMSIFERLIFLETEMKIAAANHVISPNNAVMESGEPFDLFPGKRFKAMALFDLQTLTMPLYGAIENDITLGPEAVDQIFRAKQSSRFVRCREILRGYSWSGL